MLTETATDQYQVLSNGSSVWVNWHDGMCIGRFSPVSVDIHRDSKSQIETGIECLECFTRTQGEDDWSRFVSSIFRHYGITIEPIHQPQSPPSNLLKFSPL